MTAPYISQQPVDDFGLTFADLKFSAYITGGTEATLTIPGNSPRYKALITAGDVGDIWVSKNATAQPSVPGNFIPSTSELVPIIRTICREVKAGDVLHFTNNISDAEVGVVLYALPVNS